MTGTYTWGRAASARESPRGHRFSDGSISDSTGVRPIRAAIDDIADLWPRRFLSTHSLGQTRLYAAHAITVVNDWLDTDGDTRD